jgi:hypothetical protein
MLNTAPDAKQLDTEEVKTDQQTEPGRAKRSVLTCRHNMTREEDKVDLWPQ